MDLFETSILVVDDDPHLLQSLRDTLEMAGYHVLCAHNGTEALEMLSSNKVNLILADVAMPRLNGYQLYERVRQNSAWLTIPFVLLTARAMDSDIRYGKAMGVDDYLTKPIEVEDLFAVVEGKLRRAQQLTEYFVSMSPVLTLPETLVAGNIRLDTIQHRVFLRDEPIKLSASEFRLLQHLIHHVGHVISPQELVKATHSLETDASEAGSLIRPLIRSLRRKLHYPVGETGCIENVRGVGYRLVPPCD